MKTMAKKYFVGSVGVAEAFDIKNGQYVPAFSSSTLTDSGLNIQTTKDDIRAGQGAAIQFSFYHDPSVEINLTDVLFKTEYITAQLGAEFDGQDYYKTEPLEFTAGVADLTDTVKKVQIPCTGDNQYLVWGYKTGSDEMVQMEYDPTTKKVSIIKDGNVDKTAKGTYCVNYLSEGAEAETATISTQIIPNEYRLLITAPLFAGDACSASKGKPAGKIIFEVPRFQLNGAQDFAMNMSSNQTMSLAGIALAAPSEKCGDNAGALLRIMKVVLDDADWKSEITGLVSDEASEHVGDDPIVYGIKNGKPVLIQDSELTFEYGDPAVDALDAKGKYAAAAQDETVTITLKGTETHTEVKIQAAPANN